MFVDGELSDPDRPVVRAADHVLHGLSDRETIRAETELGVVRGHPVGPSVERRLVDRAHGADHSDRSVVLGVDGTVEDEPVAALGKQLGEDRAEVGAVGGAEVADPVFAEGCADDIHIAGGVARGDVVEPRPIVRRAQCGEFGLLGNAFGETDTVETGGLQPEPVLPAAVHRSGAADAARIHADQVVAVTDVRAHRLAHVDHEVETGSAGAARIGQQYAATFRRVRGGEPGDGHGHRFRLWRRVIHRHGHLRALSTRRIEARIIAGLPGQRLLAEALERVDIGRCRCSAE